MGGGTLTSLYQLRSWDGAFHSMATVVNQAIMMIGGVGMVGAISALVVLGQTGETCPDEPGVDWTLLRWDSKTGLAVAFVSWYEQLILVSLSVQTWLYARMGVWKMQYDRVQRGKTP